MSTYELSHEHAERTARLMYCLMRNDDDFVSASEKINKSYYELAKKLYPVDPTRIGAKHFNITAARWTSRTFTNGLKRPSQRAEGKRWTLGINPYGYMAGPGEPEDDPSPYYMQYYKERKAKEVGFGKNAMVAQHVDENHRIMEARKMTEKKKADKKERRDKRKAKKKAMRKKIAGKNTAEKN